MSDTSYHLLALLPPSNILEAKNYVNESFFSVTAIKVVVKSFVLIYNTLLNY